ncbi:MAG: HPr family phosphocarrier protein [Planctomycetota bacterium]
MELKASRVITHVYGMHARASTKFVEVAQRFRSDVFVSKDGMPEVDGKSVLGVLTLGAEVGHKINLRVKGSDAEQTLAALIAVIERNFDGV